MHKLREKDIEIDFAGALNALRFDQDDRNSPEYHDLRNMNRVDFVVETEQLIYFIEVKDPSRADLDDVKRKPILRKIQSGELEDSYVNKYICTFLFRWAEGKLDKSVRYIVLVTLEAPLLLSLNECLQNRFDRVRRKSNRWIRLPLESCEAHNLDTWNKCYPMWPVSRLLHTDKTTSSLNSTK